jgi:translation initiation factor 2B subunit (eIF-2B alpha/beta/delta family)
MDDLREQIELLESSANLSTSIDDVQKAIDMLIAAREKIAAGRSAYRVIYRRMDNQSVTDPSKLPLTLAKLQDPFKKTMDAAQKDLKPIYSGLNKYGKALDKVGPTAAGLGFEY